MIRNDRFSRYADGDPPSGVGALIRRWTIPIVGGITPVLLIVINVAEFITKHLEQFRWTVTALAFVSGLMFNSYFVLNSYRLLKRWLPDNPLVRDDNQELVLVLGMAGITAVSAVGAVFCWMGLSDAANLPNRETFAYGAGSILFPIVVQEVVRRFARGETREPV
jgi:hypothetical protein